VRRRVFACTLLAIATWVTGTSAFCRSTTCNAKRASCAVDAKGCQVDGVPLRWGSMPLTFRFKRGALSTLVREEARAAVRAGFYRWSDVLCPGGKRTSLRFVEGEELEDDKPLAPDVRAKESFGVYFRDVGWPHDAPDNTFALTTLASGTTTGLVRYADIELNTASHALATGDVDGGPDLQAVVTHEVGHYIGLAHSLERNSIMADALCGGGDRCTRGKVAARRLSPDDIDAVCTLYPSFAKWNEAEERGCALRAGGVAPAWADVAITGAVVAMLALARHRLRRRRTARIG
jgi:hypothetical protein